MALNISLNRYALFNLYNGNTFTSGSSSSTPQMLFLPPHISSSSQSSKLTIASSRRPLLCRCKKEKEKEEETLEGIAQSLERDLQLAIELEDYGLAATIRDKLRILLQDTKTSVLAANARFYKAFKNGDLAAMQSLWSEGEYVCCVHPGVNGISGYDLVMSSWEYVLANYEFPLEIKVEDVVVHVKGELGFVTCMEFIKTKGSSWGKQSVTNVFEKIGDKWFICIHHASTSNFDK